MKVRNLVFLCTHGNAAKESNGGSNGDSIDEKTSLGKQSNAKTIIKLFAFQSSALCSLLFI